MPLDQQQKQQTKGGEDEEEEELIRIKRADLEKLLEEIRALKATLSGGRALRVSTA